MTQTINTPTSTSTLNEAADVARRATNEAINQIEPAVARLTSQAETLARRGMNAVRDSASNMRERATTVGDSTVRYVKDEPVKAILIAAAAGAALMALASLISSARRNR